jgi:hypothetical protein
MITMYEMIMTNALDVNACLTPRGATFSICACFGFLIRRGGASDHSPPEASGRSGSLLDSNRTLALWRPVSSAARPIAVSLERGSGLTSASGPLRDQRIRSYFARPVRYGTSASGRTSRVRSTRRARPVSASQA